MKSKKSELISGYFDKSANLNLFNLGHDLLLFNLKDHINKHCIVLKKVNKDYESNCADRKESKQKYKSIFNKLSQIYYIKANGEIDENGLERCKKDKAF